MAEYALIDMTVRSLLADILRTDVPPPGALGWGFVDDNGELIAVSLADLSSPAAAGTGLASATYEVGTAGAQTIRQATATWFGDVGIETSGGKSIPLSFGTGYTFVAGELTVLAVAGAVAGDTITYTYASGVVSGQQPAPGYTPPAIVATVAGTETGFATLADAITARPSAIYLHEDVELSTVTARFDGALAARGHVITLATGGQLRLGRNASLYNGLAADGGGSVAIVGNGVPAGGSVPAPAECVQVFDFVIEAALNLSAASAYQGLALRGNSVVSNLASGGGPVYLFDLAEVSQPLLAGFTIYDLRPGGAAPAGQLEVQVSSDSTNRVARIRLTKLRTLLAATAYQSGNASGYVLQVNAYRNNMWVPGTGRTAVADAQADIAALTPADYVAGAEMEIQVVPLAAGSNAGLVLQFAGPESVSFLAANRSARRTTSNAPPAGYTGITTFGEYEETDTAHISLVGSWASGAGAVHSGGACAVRSPNTSGTVVIRFWLTNACRFQFVGLTDASLGTLSLDLDGSYFDNADQSPPSSSYYAYYTSPIVAPGEHTLTISGQAAKTMLWDMIRFIAA